MLVSDLLKKGLENRLQRLALKLVRDAGTIRLQCFHLIDSNLLLSLPEFFRHTSSCNTTPAIATSSLQSWNPIWFDMLENAPGLDTVIIGVPAVCAGCARGSQTSLQVLFLQSNFSRSTEDEFTHPNPFISPLLVHLRCRFTSENGELVIRKIEDIDQHKAGEWEKRKVEASAQLSKLDGLALRNVLGSDHSRILGFLTNDCWGTKLDDSVPIESVAVPGEQSSVAAGSFNWTHCPQAAPIFSPSVRHAMAPPGNLPNTASFSQHDLELRTL